MTLQDIAKTLLGVIFIIAGITMNAFAFMAIYSLDKAILYANLAIINGESILSFIRPVAGLISGGHLKVIETKYIYIIISVGWLCIWMGANFVLFTKSKIPIKYILSGKYWSVIDLEFIHKRKYRESDLLWRRMKRPKHQGKKK